MISTGITIEEKCGSANTFGYTNLSEIIDLSTSERSNCPSWSSYPYDTKGTTGGFLGTNLIICGGSHDYSDECRVITPKSTRVLTKMLSKRYEADSLIIGEKYLWVSGGNDGSNTLSSSEHIEIESTLGPELPTALEGHKMININDSFTLFIGGLASGKEKRTTYYFKHEMSDWFDGPSLKNGRRYHAVGTVTDKITLKKIVVVTGGLAKEGALKSVEILMENSWSSGKNTLIWKAQKTHFTLVGTGI